MKQRATILKAIADRLNTLFGPAGTTEKRFRAVRRGPLLPVDVRPSVTVSDNGQRRDGPATESGSEILEQDSEERVLAIRITLHLAENWDRVANAEKWSDNVEELISAIAQYCPAACGVLKMQYVNDDPLDIVWTSGDTEAVWVVEFECRYFVETYAPGVR